MSNFYPATFMAIFTRAKCQLISVKCRLTKIFALLISAALFSMTLFSTALLTASSVNAQTAPPPAFGEETKGKPAISETNAEEDSAKTAKSAESSSSQDTDNEDGQQSFADNLLGEATITESRRENGQVYLIELEHSSGSKQYIEENDSDGKLSADGNDLEDEPNLPKWKLGSW